MKSKVISIVTLCVLAVVFIGCSNANESTSKSTMLEVTNPELEKSRYINEEYHYSSAYPKGWVILKVSDDTIRFYNPDRDIQYYGIWINVNGLSNPQTPEEAYFQYLAHLNEIGSNPEVLSANTVREDEDFPGYEAEVIHAIPGEPDQYRTKILFLIRGNDDYSITAMVNEEEYHEVASVFTATLDSFQFIDESTISIEEVKNSASETEGYYLIDILIVDDVKIRMDYFIKRCKMSNLEEPFYMLHELSREIIITKEAPDLGITVDDSDVDVEILRIAQEKDNITSRELNNWMLRELESNGLSEDEYREYIRNILLRELLTDYLSNDIPRVSEQLFLYGITISDLEIATEIQNRWSAGEEFISLAEEYSLDSASRIAGWESGWYPRGILPPAIENAAFEVDVGQISEPFMYSLDEDSYLIVYVSDKDPSKELSNFHLESLAEDFTDDWLRKKIREYDISYHGITRDGYCADTDAWIKEQIALE